MIVTEREREREREAETQAEEEAGSMHREPDVGFDPGSPGSRPGPKACAKPLRQPGIPVLDILIFIYKRHLFLIKIFLKDFIYLFMRDRLRERERQRYRQSEKQVPCG